MRWSDEGGRCGTRTYSKERLRKTKDSGIAVDINPDYSKSDRNKVYTWLAENSYKYGFIYRYPEDKTHITGISNELWHYRYVGVEVAEEMYKEDLCLEEYFK